MPRIPRAPPVPQSSAAFVQNAELIAARTEAARLESIRVGRPIDFRNGTGVKPKKGDPDVYILDISPLSKYQLRAWGVANMQNKWPGHYFLDFIDKETGEPVNSPPGYELYQSKRFIQDKLRRRRARHEANRIRPGISCEFYPRRVPGDEFYLTYEATPYVLFAPELPDEMMYFVIPIRDGPPMAQFTPQ